MVALGLPWLNRSHPSLSGSCDLGVLICSISHPFWPNAHPDMTHQTKSQLMCEIASDAHPLDQDPTVVSSVILSTAAVFPLLLYFPLSSPCLLFVLHLEGLSTSSGSKRSSLPLDSKLHYYEDERNIISFGRQQLCFMSFYFFWESLCIWYAHIYIYIFLIW